MSALYECHVTVTKPADIETLDRYIRIANEEGWKTSAIDGDPLLGQGVYFYFTCHAVDGPAAFNRMESLVARLQSAVIRKKIEEVVYDSKTGLDVRRLAERNPFTTAPAFLLPPEGINIESVEKDFVQQALDATRGNQTQAARLLGITRYAIRYRMKKFNTAGTTTGRYSSAQPNTSNAPRSDIK